MNICMILQSEYPPDIRVKKEVDALTQAGHNITLLCRGREEESEEIGELTINRIDDFNPLSRLIWQQLNYDIKFRKPIWEDNLEQIISAQEIDVIHVHDLPAVKSAVSVADEQNIPVIADFHEIYPAAMREWRSDWNLKTKVKRNTILKPIWRYKRLQKSMTQQVDHIITISKEAKEALHYDTGVDKEKISVVGNMVDLNMFDPDNNEPAEVGSEEEFLITYVGGFGPHRGIETAINALPEVLKEIPNARLLLVGGSDSGRYTTELKNLADGLGVSDYITFTGWVDFEEVPSYMLASDVSFILHSESNHTDVAVPHKLSQYMAMATPLIVTDRPSLKRIVSETESGLIISNDPDEFANAVIEIASNPGRQAELSENTRVAAGDKYNWERESEKLNRIYENILK